MRLDYRENLELCSPFPPVVEPYFLTRSQIDTVLDGRGASSTPSSSLRCSSTDSGQTRSGGRLDSRRSSHEDKEGVVVFMEHIQMLASRLILEPRHALPTRLADRADSLTKAARARGRQAMLDQFARAWQRRPRPCSSGRCESLAINRASPARASGRASASQTCFAPSKHLPDRSRGNTNNVHASATHTDPKPMPILRSWAAAHATNNLKPCDATSRMRNEVGSLPPSTYEICEFRGGRLCICPGSISPQTGRRDIKLKAPRPGAFHFQRHIRMALRVWRRSQRYQDGATNTAMASAVANPKSVSSPGGEHKQPHKQACCSMRADRIATDGRSMLWTVASRTRKPATQITPTLFQHHGRNATPNEMRATSVPRMGGATISREHKQRTRLSGTLAERLR